MNQEQNNINKNSLNTQNNNGASYNQPLHNPEQIYAAPSQQSQIFQQPTNQINPQQPTPPLNNTIANEEFNNQNFNNNPPKKPKINLLISISIVLVVNLFYG